jgi:hypothetical protein
MYKNIIVFKRRRLHFSFSLNNYSNLYMISLYGIRQKHLFHKISANLELHEDTYIFAVQSTLQMPMY